MGNSGLRIFTAFACLMLVMVLSCSRQSNNTETVTINNVDPRLDVNGQIIDAHGGCLQFFNGRFYLYGMAFGTNRMDTGLNNPFVVYSSPDLKDWTFEAKLLKDEPKGVYYRPYVVFNPSTKKYVLWYNWYQKFWVGQAGVAVSDSPVGPFVIVKQRVNLAGSSPGDGSLFVDDDGTGYYIYTDIANDWSVRVERLTPDFLDSTHKTSNVMSTETEAPVLFRRNNIYYALTGPLCADAAKGSEVQVFTSLSPLGPYSTRISDNINRRSRDSDLVPSEAGVTSSNRVGNLVSAQSTNSNWKTFNPATSVPIIAAQQTWVAKIPFAGEPIFIWMGDRWQSAADGTRGHDFQFWSAPLKFSEDGNILPLKNTGQWYIEWNLKN